MWTLVTGGLDLHDKFFLCVCVWGGGGGGVPFFYKGENFYDILFASLHTKLLLKSGLL